MTNEEIQAAVIEYRRAHSEISSLWSDHRPTDDPCDDISDHPQWARPVPAFLTDDEARQRVQLFRDLRRQQPAAFEWWEIPLFVVCAMAIGAAVFSAWRAAVGS
jgi:hypothetical protein